MYNTFKSAVKIVRQYLLARIRLCTQCASLQPISGRPWNRRSSTFRRPITVS